MVSRGNKEDRNFGQTHNKALIISNEEYGKIREIENLENCSNLEDVFAKEAVLASQSLKMLGFADEDIVKLQDPEWEDISNELTKIADQAK